MNRRSLLYVPGDSERMLAKAAGLDADVLLLNLEDGVSPSVKEAARANVVRALREVRFGAREVVVRINPLASPVGHRDLAAVAPVRPSGICLPKMESAEQVLDASRMLGDLEPAAGIPAGDIRLHAMIESSRGVLAAAAIAAADPRMASLMFGSADYAADVGCRPGPERAELLLALQTIVLAARAAGIDAVDAPFFDLHDLNGLRLEAAQARRLGFDGKGALHPAQLAIIHEAFASTPEEVAWAEKVIEELDGAEEKGRALATIDGQLVEHPHRLAAERILRRRAVPERENP